MALWTLAEQQMIKPLNNNNTTLFQQLQLEVEANDIQNYLGFEFYQELQRNTANYATLLNGGTYTSNGVQYRFRGLKQVFAYLLYARYVRQSYTQDTFSGIVRHTGEGFAALSSAELRNQEERYKQIAGSIWEETYIYLQTLSLPYFPNPTTKKRKIDYL
jgi:hypothetical protein